MQRHPGERRQLEIPPHCLTSNATELRSHKVSCGSSHEMGELAVAVGKTRRNPLANPIYALTILAFAAYRYPI